MEPTFLIYDNTGHEDWFYESELMEILGNYLNGPAWWIKLHNTTTNETICLRGNGEVELSNDE